MAAVAAYRDLGRMSYADSLGIQRAEFDALLAAKEKKNDGAVRVGTIFTVEHPAVYTLGRNGHEENLLVSEELLRASGAEFFRTDRGGDITFHGEGQIVVYPVLDLSVTGMSLREYVAALEEAVMRTMADYGMMCCRSAGASGVWLEGGPCGKETTRGAAEGFADAAEQKLRKICAIGVRSTRYVVMHGLALNVTTDLRRFGMINPCGFTDRGVTSMQRELGYAPDMREVKGRLVKRLADCLGVVVDD